jgi:hypothetical protein
MSSFAGRFEDGRPGREYAGRPAPAHRRHNLKNVDANIPRDVSGSGKSSLAFGHAASAQAVGGVPILPRTDHSLAALRHISLSCTA